VGRDPDLRERPRDARADFHDALALDDDGARDELTAEQQMAGDGVSVVTDGGFCFHHPVSS
jgi:hypothetical protein